MSLSLPAGFCGFQCTIPHLLRLSCLLRPSHRNQLWLLSTTVSTDLRLWRVRGCLVRCLSFFPAPKTRRGNRRDREKEALSLRLPLGASAKVNLTYVYKGQYKSQEVVSLCCLKALILYHTFWFLSRGEGTNFGEISPTSSQGRR